jgi:transposase
VLGWLADDPRWVFHFTPKSASWINAVESFFSAITRRRIRRGVFRSVADLQDAIAHYIRGHNRAAKRFVWTKPADAILAKLARLPEPSE